MIDSIKFQKEVSPKEYNYRNDAIDCFIRIHMNKLIAWCYENKRYLNDYFKKNYTSCSGFISLYPNNFDEWEAKTEGFTELDNHYLGVILNAWCEMNEIDENTLSCLIEIYAISYVDSSKLIEDVIEREMEMYVRLIYQISLVYIHNLHIPKSIEHIVYSKLNYLMGLRLKQFQMFLHFV